MAYFGCGRKALFYKGLNEVKVINRYSKNLFSKRRIFKSFVEFKNIREILKGRYKKMRGMSKKFIIVLLISLFLLGIGQAVWAEKWQPYQFKGNERFEYKILLKEYEQEEEAIYILDIKESSEKSTSGEQVFEVTYTIKGAFTKDELGPEKAFGLWGVFGICLNMLVVNPYYVFFFSQMDLKVGEKINFSGVGIIKVIGKQKIAGREGFICQLFQADEEDEMIAEWVIDPDLALPLKSKMFKFMDDELQGQGQIELIKYIQY